MGYAGANAWQTVGRGIKGIGAIAGLTRREREEEKKRLEQEHYARDQDKFQTDMTLAQAGGGRGDVPTVEETRPIPQQPGQRPPGMDPQPGSGPLFPADDRGEGVQGPNMDEFMPIPEFGDVPEFTTETPDDRYQAVGAGDNKGFVPRQEWLIEQEAMRQAELKEQSALDIDAIASGNVGAGDDGYGNIMTRTPEARLHIPKDDDADGADDDEMSPTERAEWYNKAGYGPTGQAHTTQQDRATPSSQLPEFEETMEWVLSDDRFTTEEGEDLTIEQYNEIVESMLNKTFKDEDWPVREPVVEERGRLRLRWPWTRDAPGPEPKVGEGARAFEPDSIAGDGGGTLVRDTALSADSTRAPEPGPRERGDSLASPAAAADTDPSTPRARVGPGADPPSAAGTMVADSEMASREDLDLAWDMFRTMDNPLLAMHETGYTADEITYMFTLRDAEEAEGAAGGPPAGGIESRFDQFEAGAQLGRTQIPTQPPQTQFPFNRDAAPDSTSRPPR